MIKKKKGRVRLEVMQESKKENIKRNQNTCIDRGLMTMADDYNSGRRRMMRKCRVRFPEKGVATHWSL